MSRGTVNKAILIGRVGKDPDLRYTPGGTSVAGFSIATNFRTKDSEGNWQENTEWHNISAFGNLADFVGNYIKKGRLVYIEGRLHTRSWEDQNNNKHYRTEIVANTIQLLGPKPEEAEGEEPVEPAAEKPKPSSDSVQEPPAEGATEEDDLPF
ncbi:MAG: single-stranded DNA-binding protein [Calditrichaeota bacterium]|nr:single-stranded DNA-binding protein [Calditrichota bacterium]